VAEAKGAIIAIDGEERLRASWIAAYAELFADISS